MGGSAGKAVDKITKETSGALKKSTGGAVDLGSPNDSGVDISSLMGGATQIWNAMK